MLHGISELIAAVPVLALVWLAWHLSGKAAQRAGTGRLQVLGAAALLGWLLGL